MMLYYTSTGSPLGEITLCSADGCAISGLWLNTQEVHLENAERCDSRAVFHETRLWLKRYFAGERMRAGEIPLEYCGTDFRKRVWSELLTIPYGTTVSYGELAKRIGCSSAQAVGQAVGRNPIPILVPCHRVIGSDGALTGYAGGLDKKRILLKIEGIL